MQSKTSIKSVKGMNDIFPPEIYLWRHAENIIRPHLEDFGYSEIKTPVVEPTALFQRSVGEATDIVSKEMYTFADRHGDSLSLRPEGTAPVVRALVEHQILNNEPAQKLYYWGPMFRYERPQKGRYRQFHQYGVECFGLEGPSIDAELIGMLHRLYQKFGLPELQVGISSLGCDECRPVFRHKLIEILTPQKEKLCPDCQVRLEKNPLRILDCKVPSCQALAATLPTMLDFLCGACQTHFDGLRDALVLMGTPFAVNARLVRGFDYYNRTVFEITSSHLGAQNAVGGGGRYDKLVHEMGGPQVPAIGYAGGVERLVLLLQEQGLDVTPKLKLFIILPDPEGFRKGLVLAQRLRNNGVHVELDHSGKSMKAQMKRADKLGAQYCLILGSQEVAQGQAVLRNMSSKVQETMSLGQLEADLLKRLL